MQHIRVIAWESLYGNNEPNSPRWEYSPYFNDESEITPQGHLPAIMIENFPPLLKKDQQGTKVPPGLWPGRWPGETWSDVARFDRFRKLRKLAFEIRQQVISDCIDNWRYSTDRGSAMDVGFSMGRVLNVDHYRKNFRHDDHYPMSTEYPCFLPPICLASKQLYLEATPVFIAGFEWELQSAGANRWLTEFLSNFTVHEKEVGFDSVRSIRFSNFDWFPGMQTLGQNMDMQLIKRCRGLKYLKLAFEIDCMVNPRYFRDVSALEDDTEHDMRDINEIVEYYGLDDIFECRSIKKLDLVGFGKSYDGEVEENTAENRLVELAQWIREGFWQRRGQVLEVEVKWPAWPFEY
jgi:hypothetical protein